MSTLKLSGPTLHTSGQIIPSSLILKNGRIVSINKGESADADLTTTGVIAPGFIDLQVNGAYGYDFTDSPQSIASVADRLPETGVTAFLPTRITSALETYVDWLHAAQSATRHKSGARVLGIHLEGPYFNILKKGAHNPALIRSQLPVGDLACYVPSPLVKIVTLAPEVPGAHEVIGILRSRGIIVSAGHSNATFAQAEEGFAAGINWGTHLFNAMSDFKHRDPGLPGALLTSAICCGLIADGIHVHPAALRLAWLAKGAGGITLVSDCMAAMGMPPGTYRLGTAGDVTVDETTARLADGTLAGSIATMDHCLRTMIEASRCSLADGLLMAATTPADLLGLPNKGRIAVDCDADLVLLDETQHVQATIVAGEVAYQRK